MDNKKWGKRFSTIFWWSFAILPLIVALIQFIGYHLTFNSGITSAAELASYHSNINGDFTYILNYVFIDAEYPFETLQITFIRDMFIDLLENIGVADFKFAYLFGWMCSVFFYHVIFDVSVWIFRMLHSWLDRWCCE